MSYCRKTHEYFVASEGVTATNELGEEHLYSPFAKFLYCYDCGKRLIQEDTSSSIQFRKDINGNVLCAEHYDEYTICEYCGNWRERETVNTVEICNGDIVRIDNECLERFFFKCECCGRYEEEIAPEHHTANNGRLCENCADGEEYQRCFFCGRYDETDNMIYTDDEHYVCHSIGCRSQISQCEECWGSFAEHSYTRVYYDEENETDVCLCENCATETRFLQRTRENEKTINNYHYKPTPTFKHLEKEKTKEFFGFEIEVSGNGNKARKFLEFFKDNNDVYLKTDSSIENGGFEIVTEPMSRKYFYNVFVPALTKGMEYLKYNSFKGHNKGGIHIHVSNEAISPKQYKSILMLLYSKSPKSYKTWLAITQRHDYQLSRWARIGYNSLNDGTLRTVFKEADKMAKSSKNQKPPISGNRYFGVNTQNKHTTEFRIFNSNIRIERIIKNAEVIFSLLDFADTGIMPTMNNYLLFIENNKDKYKYLFDFLVEKHIWITKKQKQEVEKVMKKLEFKNKNDLEKYINSLALDINLTVDDDDERTQICA